MVKPAARIASPLCSADGYRPPQLPTCRPVVPPSPAERTPMNNIVYIVGAVVIVIAILSFLGLR